MKVENAYLRWIASNVDEKVRELEKDVGVLFMAVAEFEQQNVLQVAYCVQTAFLSTGNN